MAHLKNAVCLFLFFSLPAITQVNSKARKKMPASQPAVQEQPRTKGLKFRVGAHVGTAKGSYLN